MSFFDLSFWQQLVTTFVGVGAGIPAGLYLESRLEKRAHREQARALSAVILKALEHNAELLDQLSRELAIQPLAAIPTYSLDIVPLEVTASRVFDAFPVDAAVAVDHVRYELGHFNTKLDLLRTLFPGHVYNPGGGNAIRSLQGTCVAHLPNLQEVVAAAIKATRKSCP